MTETDIALLKEENAQLKKIIAILIEQNEALKSTLAVRQMANEGNNSTLAISQMTKGTPNSFDAFSKITNGNPNDDVAIIQITNGNLNSGLAVSQMTNGTPSVSGDIHQMTNGNTENLPSLPAFLPIDTSNSAKLYHLLKKEVLGKVHISSVKNASSLLLHFYNKGAGDYTTLRKLTGLSNFGLAKYLRSLKKRGLIERDGWQKFKLTAQAVEIIAKAGCTA